MSTNLSCTGTDVVPDIIIECETVDEVKSHFKSISSEHLLNWRKRASSKTGLLGLETPSKIFEIVKNHKYLKWSGVPLANKNIPYIIVEREFYICHQGPDVDAKQKEQKRAAQQINQKQDHHYGRVNKVGQRTKKFGCQAEVEIHHILLFKQYKSVFDDRFGRSRMSRKFRDDVEKLTSADEMKTLRPQHRYIFRMSDPKTHTGHKTTGLAAQQRVQLDPQISNKAKELAKDGVRNISEADRHIKAFVKREIGEDLKHSHQHCPTDRDIWNLMSSVKSKSLKSHIDEENLQENCKEWIKKDDNHFLRLSKKASHDQSAERFLFVYQSAWQRRLLSLYGTKLVLLDATYQTSKYDLPLFMLCVKSNSRYMVVGCFITQYEDCNSIKEALEILKSWNESWKPSNFMTDCCAAEIKALEETFPGSKVLLCMFHREQAWNRYIDTKDNGLITVKGALLGLLRKVASSRTEEEYESALTKLKDSDIWINNTNFQRYFQNTWERISEKWVECFRDPLMAIRTNNGIERQNRTLKEKYLNRFTKSSLGDLVNVIVNKFFPGMYQSPNQRSDLNLVKQNGSVIFTSMKVYWQ